MATALPTKRCPKCKEVKPRGEFYRRTAHGPNGVSYWCKKCFSAQRTSRRGNPYWEARFAWARINSRAGNRYGLVPDYDNVEVRMTRDEFLAWAIPAYEAWFRDRPGEKPTIDRVRSEGHYEISNIRLATVMENSRNTKRCRNPSAPEGQAWCSGCQAYHDKSAFSASPRSPYGVAGVCREHLRLVRAARKEKNPRTVYCRNRPVHFNGESLTLSEWAKKTGISLRTLSNRLYLGWAVERTLTTPPQQKSGNTGRESTP